jgi:uncharacterized membrane protein (DUF2068 family)
MVNEKDLPAHVSAPTKAGLRIVALMEAAKGLLVLVAGFGLLTLLHRDVQAIALRLISRLHLNPSKHYPTIFIDAASHVTDLRLWQLAWFALVYSTLRLIEAYGLWHERRWAEWVALLSGGVYLPIEIIEVIRVQSPFRVCTLLVNLVVVAWMVYVLLHPSRAQKAEMAK